MPPTLQELEAAVLALEPHEREYLLQRLILSLDDQDGLNNPEEVERAWLEEVERRRARLLSGETKAGPAEEALARVRARLRSA